MDGRAAEQTDRTLLNGIDPERFTIIVDLERFLIEHVERIAQLHMTIDVIEERIGIRIANGVFKTHDLGILRGHIHDNVGRDASIFIRPPLEEIGIVERTDAHWLSFIVDLRIEIGDLELRNVVSHGTHGAVAE